jgi:hypothetical protein
MMVFSKEDRILIQNLYEFKGYGAKKLIKEFPQKGWKLRGLNYLLTRLRETGTTDRVPGSGRPRTSAQLKTLIQFMTWYSVRRTCLSEVC